MASGKRKAKKISEVEFRNRIVDKMNKIDPEMEFDFESNFDIYELFSAFPKVEKDVSKIEFDMENYDIEKDGLIGFNTIGDLTFLGVYAGGDWEMPIFFILYFDQNNQLRGYVPTEGNVFNRTMKAAFGNYEDEDEKDAKKQGYESYDEMEFDWDKIEEDIKNRIEIA